MTHPAGGKWTREQFEAYYAGNSRSTVAALYRDGLVAVPCHGEASDCDYEDCHGWSMLTRDFLTNPVTRDLYGWTADEVEEALAHADSVR